MIATNASGAAVFSLCSYREGVTISRQADSATELIVCVSIAGLDVDGLLAPNTIVTTENVHGTGIKCRVISLIATNSGSIAVLRRCSHRQGVTIGG